MFNKKIILTLCIAFSFCMNAIAQNPIVKIDTTIRVKVIKENKDLFFPQLKNPQQYCKKLREAWNNYLERNPAIVKEFGLDDDTANYYCSATIEILKNGIVSDVNQRGSNSSIGYVCYNALRTTLKKSGWIASYQKKGKTKKYLDTTVLIYFTITKAGLRDISFKDLKTSHPLYKCFE